MNLNQLITELKEAHEQATQGEWEDNGYSVKIDRHEFPLCNRHDSKAICTLRNNLPAIIQALEEKERYRKALQEITLMCGCYYDCNCNILMQEKAKQALNPTTND